MMPKSRSEKNRNTEQNGKQEMPTVVPKPQSSASVRNLKYRCRVLPVRRWCQAILADISPNPISSESVFSYSSGFVLAMIEL